MAWYNKYRPHSFDEVIGQSLIKEVLQKTLETGKTKHAYLFNGPKGIGKTTLARIFASSLNKVSTNPEATFDIIEMDAASNTGVDDIRSLIESSKTPPLSGNHKIYIIDEVHMLSKSAMNALLKILEEPPQYLVFLFATTNPEKLLPTIHSRVTKLNLKAHTSEDIFNNLKSISQKENMNIDDDALSIITSRSEGSQRDAINLLETVSGYGLKSFTSKNVSEILGIANITFIEQVLSEVVKNECSPSFLKELQTCGIEGSSLLNQILTYILDSSLYKNDFTYDKITIPLAEVIRLDLPLTDAVYAFATLQSKLRDSGILPRKDHIQTPSPTPTSSSPNQPSLKPTQTPAAHYNPIKPTKSEYTQNLNQEPSQSSAHIDPKPTQPVRQEHNKTIDNTESLQPSDTPTKNTSLSEISLEQVQSAIKAISQNPKTPITIKLLSLDLVAHQISGSTITVSVSNGVYFGQLQSDKNRQAISTLLSQALGSNVSIYPIQRKNNTPIEIKSDRPEPLPKSVDFIGKGSQKPQEENVSESEKADTPPQADAQNEQSTESKPDQSGPETENLFYKVYHKKAPNMDHVSIDIIPKPIPRPEEVSQKQSNDTESLPENKEDWSSQITDFEFE